MVSTAAVISRPTALTAPAGARDLGIAPFLSPGAQIDWHYRKPRWQEGDASNIAPMRVVRDDEQGLVAHQRTGNATHSSDHVLDVEIDAAGAIRLKDEDEDEDELEAAIEQGRIAAHEAEQITRHADAAIAAFHAGHWAFARELVDWRPNPAWTIPQLSDLPH